MISAQKEIEFLIRIMITSKQLEASGYVWILTQMKILLTESGLCRRDVYGKMMELANLDKVQGIIIRLRQKENVESSKNYLIAMLEELLKKGDKEKKKKNLSSNFGLIMTEETIRRIDHMCNLSDLIVEQGIEQRNRTGQCPAFNWTGM